MRRNRHIDHDALASKLIRDELFDLSLYQALRQMTTGSLRDVLDDLIPVERKHCTFWQDFFDSRIEALDRGRRLKLWFIVGICRLFGVFAIHLVLEAIEVYGVRKYLTLWDTYRGGPLGDAMQDILEEELQHEDRLVTAVTERKIAPEKIRNIFLGFNDGLVEILGAVSGFYGAFDNAIAVLMAAITVAVAGALSMAAGAYVASSSEQEVRKMEHDRRQFLGESALSGEESERPASAAGLVGVSYFAGATVPVLPVLLGARQVLFSVLAGGTMIIVVSMILAFLSGMDVKKRILLNLVIIAAAVGVTYAIGILTKMLWGLSL